MYSANAHRHVSRHGQHLQCWCLPKDILGEGHALHEGHWRQVHSVCHITHGIDAGYGCLIEAVYLDLSLGAQLHPNLQFNADQSEGREADVLGKVQTNGRGGARLCLGVPGRTCLQ